MLRDDTIKRNVGQRYNYTDLIKADELTVPPILKDGFDAYGQVREFVRRGPTPEQAARFAGRLEEPEHTRLVIRHHTRIKGVWELMASRGTITEPQRQAGDRLTEAVAGLQAGGRSAGFSTGGRGGDGNESERRQKCRERLDQAAIAIGNVQMFGHLLEMAELDLTADVIGYRLGARSKRTACRLGGKAVADALQRLVKRWRLG